MYTEENIAVVQITEYDNTTQTCNKFSTDGVSDKSSCYKTAGIRPYRFQAVHHLQQLNAAAEILYCQYLRRIEWVHV
jgi:hypothetical protein